MINIRKKRNFMKFLKYKYKNNIYLIEADTEEEIKNIVSSKKIQKNEVKILSTNIEKMKKLESKIAINYFT